MSAAGISMNFVVPLSKQKSRHRYTVARLRSLYGELLQEVVIPGYEDEFPPVGTNDDATGPRNKRGGGADNDTRRKHGGCLRISGTLNCSNVYCVDEDEENDNNVEVLIGDEDDEEDIRNFRRTAAAPTLSSSLPASSSYTNILKQRVLPGSRKKKKNKANDLRSRELKIAGLNAAFQNPYSHGAINVPSSSSSSGTYSTRSLIAATATASAWRILSATPSPNKEGDNGGALAMRDDAAVAALAEARATEARVVEIIRCIGEVVVYGEQNSFVGSSGSDDDGGAADLVMEYFCEKNILALLVDIARAVPPNATLDSVAENYWHEDRKPTFQGVTWTPLVKSQVLQTVSILVSNIQEPKSLYYLLSNNHVNDLVASLVPLRRWTDHALEEIMPVYISFLKTLALQLASAPHLFQFFVDERYEKSGQTPFRLFFATVEVATSQYAQSDSFVHLTALNIILNLCQIPDDAVQTTVGEASYEQRVLFGHLCQRLTSRYARIAQLTAGKVVDPIRSAALGTELAEMQDQLHFVNDLLWCGVRPLNVRLCEFIMRGVVYRPLLRNVVRTRRSGGGGRNCIYHDEKGNVCHSVHDLKDDDMIVESDALAQTSVLTLSLLFLTLEYPPLLRMVAVATMHPLSPAEWTTQSTPTDMFPPGSSRSWGRESLNRNAKAAGGGRGGEYILTPVLNAVVRGRCKQNDAAASEGNTNDSHGTCDSESEEDTTDLVEVVSNPYREEILRLLRGDAGDWRFIPAAMLLESILESESLERRVLSSLGMLSHYLASDCEEGEEQSFEYASSSESFLPSPYEEALAAFLSRERRSSSVVSARALECGGSVGLSLLAHSVLSMTREGTEFEGFNALFCSSPLVRGFISANANFAKAAKRLQEAPGVSELFVDLVELAISSRYVSKRVNSKAYTRKKAMHCSLLKFKATELKSNSEILVRKSRNVSVNEVEEARFAIQMTLHFRALCKVLFDLNTEVMCVLGPNSASPRWVKDKLKFCMYDEADEDLLVIAGMKERPAVGTDLDLRGRTTFVFSPTSNIMDSRSKARLNASIDQEGDRPRNFAEEVLRRASPQTKLMLVLDPTDIFLVKPDPREKGTRGAILCSVPLRCVIAAAADDIWLHVAVRQMDDVGVLIKNGNMALRFGSVGACLIVKQYLERSRTILRNDLMNRIDSLLTACLHESYYRKPNAKDKTQSTNEKERMSTVTENMSQSMAKGTQTPHVAETVGPTVREVEQVPGKSEKPIFPNAKRDIASVESRSPTIKVEEEWQEYVSFPHLPEVCESMDKAESETNEESTVQEQRVVA